MMNDLQRQVEHAIDIFKGKTKGYVCTTISYLTMPLHTRSEHLMRCLQGKCPKVLSYFVYLLIISLTDPKADWTPIKGGSRMCHGVNPQSQMLQSIYFSEDVL